MSYDNDDFVFEIEEDDDANDSYSMEFERGPRGRPGKDGKSVTVEDVKPLLEKMVAGIKLPTPEKGPPGKPGKDGKSVTVEDVKPVLADLVAKIKIPTPVPGDDGKDGVSLQYKWDGTKLGIKREDEKDFKFTDLKGEPGTSYSVFGGSGSSRTFRLDSVGEGTSLIKASKYTGATLKSLVAGTHITLVDNGDSITINGPGGGGGGGGGAAWGAITG